ncbi:MAG: redox-sensing transcriptional repressor Rex [Bacteroidales bacterium]|jgi:redox-sensing transcriptional repressor|nr:redox-sensing transcriptional repressor Rex [Bacteroidales bacterium]
MKKLPPKTIERLSAYRRTLLNCITNGKTYIYSHEIANLHNITAVQVRRDIMLLGHSSTLKKGYDVKALVNKISTILDTKEGLSAAIIGIGNLGKAITTYFNGKRSKLRIVAAFDTSPDKINKVIAGVKCYSMNDILKVIKEQNITIAILTVPPEHSTEISDKLVNAGIKGILNYTPSYLNVPSSVFLEEYDMVTSLEKVSYFVKQSL